MGKIRTGRVAGHTTSRWEPVVAVLDERELSRKNGELTDTLRLLWQCQPPFQWEKKKLDTKAVAVAVGWLLLSMLGKAIDAELRAKAKARWSQ